MDVALLKWMKSEYEKNLKKAEADLLIAQQKNSSIEIHILESEISKLKNLLKTCPV